MLAPSNPRAIAVLVLGAALFACGGEVSSSDGGSGSCGNGIRESGERCDDGNTDDGDCCNATCSMGNCLVPQTHETVQAGVDDDACPTVWVMPGNYVENVSIARDVRIEAVSGGPVVVDGSGAGRVVRVTGAHTVALVGLTLTNGNAEAGAGVRNDGGDLTLVGGRVHGNTSEGPAAQGAGIWSEGGVLTLEGTDVDDNEAIGTERSAEGGGIRVRNGGLVLSAARVTGNRVTVVGAMAASGRGAGVALESAQLTMSAGAEVADNVVEVQAIVAGARAHGGGVSVLDDGSIDLSGASSIARNEARATGPGAHALGGGIAASAIAIRILEGSAITGNLARAEGTDAQRADAHGGGISLISGGSIELGDGSVDTNVAEASGPSELHAVGGGIAGDGTDIQITSSRVRGNEARVLGAGALAASSAFGGGVHAFLQTAGPQSISLVRSELADNVASVLALGTTAGAGLFANAGAGASRMRVTLDRTTVSGNVATAGDLARGGGVTAYANVPDAQVELIVQNSTLSGNRAEATAADGIGSGGAIALVARDAAATAALYLSSSTVAANSAIGAGLALGGGIESQGAPAESSCTITMHNTILATNLADGGPDCSAASTLLVSLDFNLIGDVARCVFGGSTGSHVVGMDPQLTALAIDGGETATHAIAASSPAADAGDPAGCSDHEDVTLTVDQRGLPRDANGRCDIGAYELQP